MALSSSTLCPPIIRPARPTDAEPLAQLATAVFRHTYGAAIPDAVLTPYLARAFSPGAIALAIDNPTTYFFVAAQADTLLGYSKCTATVPPARISGENALELVNLYIEPTHQGRGIGKALLHAAMQYALTQGYTRMWLCVWQANQSALRFYQRLGFAIIGTTVIPVDGVLFDDWVMQKSLLSEA